MTDIDTTRDYIATCRAFITLRVEGMAEDMVKPYFDDKAHEQGLVRRLRDAVENTDFYLEIDVTDIETEVAD